MSEPVPGFLGVVVSELGVVRAVSILRSKANEPSHLAHLYAPLWLCYAITRKLGNPEDLGGWTFSGRHWVGKWVLGIHAASVRVDGPPSGQHGP